MRVVLFGANGQLGQDVQDVFKDAEVELISFSRADIDISDRTGIEKQLSLLKPNYVINAAAYTNVDGAEDAQAQAMAINAAAVAHLGAVAKQVGFVLFHISTDYVFNGEKNTPYSEDDECQPIGFYGHSKREGELSLINENVPCLIIRTAWLYSHRGKNFLNSMRHYGKERDLLTVVFDQVGSPTYAAHLAKAMLQIIEKSYQPTSTEIYHFSNEGVCSWYDFTLEILEQSGIDCKVLPIESKDFPTKTKRPAYSVLNKAKMKTHFGLEITHWKQALKECISKF
ncbi:MAG: dTDP-4-dehydrorhamnose reductase [Bacteroidetes bacterium]|nr:dTDP-4-dehydrorhamnose reductase [Bacteroidota bacterium]